MTMIDLVFEEGTGVVLPVLLLFSDVLGSISLKVLIILRNLLFSAALSAIYQQLSYQQNKPPLQHP
jgi:hypothetical protein